MTPLGELMGLQDEVLIAITDGRPIQMDRLRRLPPWRAVLVARVAAKAGALGQAEVDALVAEARSVGGTGELARAL